MTQMSIDTPPSTISSPTISPRIAPNNTSSTNTNNNSNININVNDNNNCNKTSNTKVNYSKIIPPSGSERDETALSELVTDSNFYRCVLVQDIPDSLDEIKLCDLFWEFGKIEKLWIHSKNDRNRFGRATIIFENAEDAEMAEAIMNETEIEDRTLQIHIGVPPTERAKASEKRDKERTKRKLMKQREIANRFDIKNSILNNMNANNDYMFAGPAPPYFNPMGMRGRGGMMMRGRGRGRGRGGGFYGHFDDNPYYGGPYGPRGRGRGRGRGSYY